MADRDISPAELRDKDDVQLIDVREDYEWEAGRMPGARHIELGRVAAEAQSIDRDKPVVFYCRVGGRSAMAADAFLQAGYDAYSLEGGILAWEGEGGALEPEGGSVAAH